MGLETNFDMITFAENAKDAAKRGQRAFKTFHENTTSEAEMLAKFRGEILRRIEAAAAAGRGRAKILHFLRDAEPQITNNAKEKVRMRAAERAEYGLHDGDTYVELAGEEIGDDVCRLFFKACELAGLHPRAFYQKINAGHEYVLTASW